METTRVFTPSVPGAAAATWSIQGIAINLLDNTINATAWQDGQRAAGRTDSYAQFNPSLGVVQYWADGGCAVDPATGEQFNPTLMLEFMPGDELGNGTYAVRNGNVVFGASNSIGRLGFTGTARISELADGTNPLRVANAAHELMDRTPINRIEIALSATCTGINGTPNAGRFTLLLQVNG